MNKILVEDIKNLKPGMVLADDIRHNVSGIVLFSSGMALSESTIKKLQSSNISDQCLVYDPDTMLESYINEVTGDLPLDEVPPDLFDRSELPADKDRDQKDEDSVKINAEYISKESQKVYNHTLKAIKNLFENINDMDTIYLDEAKKAAGNLASQVERDPQILLQISVLKAVDNYTYSHGIHVSIYAAVLAKYLGFSSRDIYQVGLAGLLHDIGKTDIPQEVLFKPGQLTPEEYDVMKEHVRHSFRRLYKSKGMNNSILQGIIQHHEKVDGTGYLQKLKDTEIHKWARIIAIADVYDAVTTKRVYKDAMLPHEAAEILMGSIGHLDNNYLKTFLSKISIYPVGCRVVLNTGEMGTVIATNPQLPTRPLVYIKVKAKTGNLGDPESAGKVINLMESLSTFIVKIVQ